MNSPHVLLKVPLGILGT
ncbi:hypothetical protein E2C01_083300 [Portunus trituberculatus]|uniref:Uncharacterized protein n=1 Tax=Portunus trituberculatus TaxID=210409 RepID=A0A5B7J631_PORTR|nr:hypothetical protein [Portunus trituberculatus]